MCNCANGKRKKEEQMAKNRSRQVAPVAAPGEQKPGYVLAEVLFTRGAPDSKVPGVGRYPRMLEGQKWYVHADDVALQPEYFKLVEAPAVPVVASSDTKPFKTEAEKKVLVAPKKADNDGKSG